MTLGICECGCGQKTNLATRTRKSRGWILGEHLKFVRGHDSRRAIPDAKRFFSKVHKDGPIPANHPELGPCWIWKAGKSDGYGSFCVNGRTVHAHRFAYLNLRGEIPEGLEPDHLCRIRRCVNPFHLELVSQKVNILRGDGPPAQNARKTFCKRGHPLNSTNTRIRKNGNRECRICSNEQSRRWKKLHARN